VKSNGKAPLHLIQTAAAWGKRERWRGRERDSDRIDGEKVEGGREGVKKIRDGETVKDRGWVADMFGCVRVRACVTVSA
jgi:hypothetical protein